MVYKVTGWYFEEPQTDYDTVINSDDKFSVAQPEMENVTAISFEIGGLTLTRYSLGDIYQDGT